MLYVPSVVLVLVGLVLAGVLVVRALRGVGRVRSAVRAAGAGVGDEAGLLRARSAALRVAIDERRRSSGRVPSAGRPETGGRP